MIELNHVSIIMDSKSQNESFARIAAAAFIAQIDPTINDITEIKTAVSEAVTNAIIHGYADDSSGEILMDLKLESEANGLTYELTIEVKDNGVGIPDVEAALQPLFTSKPELERSGMGFTMMEAFMDEVKVSSVAGDGTHIIMKKQIARV